MVYASSWGSAVIIQTGGWQQEWNPAFMPSVRVSSLPAKADAGLPFSIRRRRGFGDAAQEAAQYTSVGGSVAASTVGVLGATGTIAASTASLAVPLIGVGVAAVIGAIALIKNSGCGQTCIITSDDANKIEPLLKQNLDGYMAGPHTVASQQAALQNFDYLWNMLVQACGNPQLGNAGKRCISDRQAGSCKWQDNAGGCWNWFVGYRDPIANDPNVKASQSLSSLTGGASVYDTVGAAFSSGGFAGLSWSQIFIPALLLVALWVVS